MAMSFKRTLINGNTHISQMFIIKTKTFMVTDYTCISLAKGTENVQHTETSSNTFEPQERKPNSQFLRGATER